MTRNHSYSTPEFGEAEWHEPLNQNFRQLDTNVEIRDHDSQRSEYEPKPNAKFYAIDTYAQYIGDGREWNRVRTSGLDPTYDSISTKTLLTNDRSATAIIRADEDDIIRGVTSDAQYKSYSFRDVIDSVVSESTTEENCHETLIIRGSFDVDNSSGPIELPSRTALVLNGTLTAMDETTTLISVRDHSQICGGTYDGGREGVDSDDTGVSVISVDSRTDVTIESVTVKNGWARGIEVNYPDSVRIRNVTARNCHRNLMVWVDPADLKSHDGVCYVNNFSSLDAVDTSFDITAPSLQVDGFYSRNSTPAFVADGWRNLTMSNVDVDSGMNLTTGDWDGNIADGARLSNVSAMNLYLNFRTGMRDLQLQNVRVIGGSDGIRIGIESDQLVESIELSNVIVRDCDWTGIKFQQSNGGGRFDAITLNNCHVFGNGIDGFFVEAAGTVKLNNCIFAGNENSGISAADTTDISLTNTDTIDSMQHSHHHSISFEGVEKFKAACCTFESEAGYETDKSITVSTAACMGNYPSS